MKFDKILKNKYLYYAAIVLMVINVLGYVAMGSIECILVLGGAAYLAQHFTKNRTVDILIGIFVANILFGCGRLREGFREGMEQVQHGAAKAATEAKKSGDAKKLNAAANIHHTAQKHCKGKNCKTREGVAGVGGAGTDSSQRHSEQSATGDSAGGGTDLTINLGNQETTGAGQTGSGTGDSEATPKQGFRN